jgi:hypothetical protein
LPSADHCPAFDVAVCDENRIKQAATDFDMTLLNAAATPCAWVCLWWCVPPVPPAMSPVVTHQLEFWLGVIHRLSAYRQPDCFRGAGGAWFHSVFLYVTVTPSATTGFQYLPGGQLQLQASGTGGSAATTTTKIAICDVTGKSSTMAQQVNILANGRPQRLNLGTCP